MELLLGTDAGLSIAGILEKPGVALHVPALCDVEVTSTFRRAIRQGLVSNRRAEVGLQDYIGLRVTRHGHTRLLSRILGLASNFTAYDACYVALAEALSGELLTADEGLARATRTHTRVPTVL